MQPHDYQQLTQDLLARASADPRVIGLVALGSMADQSHAPDEWSDHDFFLIVESGLQAHYRAHLDWLPAHETIVVSFIETQHGLKVIYENGHLLEFAVFDPSELALARANDYRVLLDRGGVAEALAAIQETQHRYREDTYYAGMFIAHLLVGATRCLRGEVISGQVFIRHYAVDDLLNLLAQYLPADKPALLDNLDPLRRFEIVFPQVGADIHAALNLPPFAGALALLDVFESQLRHRLPDYPARGVAAIRQILDGHSGNAHAGALD